jgi:hypothetical protein
LLPMNPVARGPRVESPPARIVTTLHGCCDGHRPLLHFNAAKSVTSISCRSRRRWLRRCSQPAPGARMRTSASTSAVPTLLRRSSSNGADNRSMTTACGEPVGLAILQGQNGFDASCVHVFPSLPREPFSQTYEVRPCVLDRLVGRRKELKLVVERLEKESARVFLLNDVSQMFVDVFGALQSGWDRRTGGSENRNGEQRNVAGSDGAPTPQELHRT